MSLDAQAEKHTDLSDPEKRLGPSAAETLQQIQQGSVTATGAPVDETANSTPSQQLYGWRLYTVQLALCLALFLGALDSSIVATALVTIGRDFNNFIQLQWIVLAYLLTYLGFAFIFSRISDVIGRKWASIAAVGILTASSLACGLSQSLTQLIIFRAFQGVGGSGVNSMPFTVLPEITPPRKFALLGVISAVTFSCSSVLGPTLGGIITTHSTWRWIFFFNVPVGIFIIALMLLAWPKLQVAGKISWCQLDVIGCLLCIAASVLLVFALQQAGAGAYAWSSVIIIATLTMSGVAAVALFFWIWYLSNGTRRFTPLFPARIVLHRVLGANVVVSTLVGYVLYTVLVELPERFQLVNGKTSQTAGIALLPLLCSSAVASGIAGWLSRESNRSFYTLTISSAFMVLGTGLFTSISSSSAVPNELYAYEVLLGFGLGGTLVSSILTVKLNACEEDAASAQGLQSQARILGGNIGLALATIILNIHLTSELKGVLTPAQISDVRSSLNAIEEFSPREMAAVAESFAHAFKTQLQVCIGISAISLACCLLAWQRHPPTFLDLGKTERRREG